MASLTTKPGRRVIIILLLVVATLCSLVSFFILAYLRTPQAKSAQIRNSPIVGTWLGPRGNVLDLRSDGTARYRLDQHSRDVSYFEWMLDGNEFQIFTYAKRRSYGWFLRRLLLDDRPSDRFTVVTMNAKELVLRTADGEVVRYVPTEDEGLERAP